MRYKIMSAIVASGLLAGCVTYTAKTPTAPASPRLVQGISLVNGSPATGTHVFFDDGITKGKANYRGWTQMVINNFATTVPTDLPAANNKTLFFYIEAISCSGHYVSACVMTVRAKTGAGYEHTYQSERVHGYPVNSALKKAIQNAANQISQDQAIQKYLRTAN